MENKVIPNREVPSLVENTWNVSELCYNSSSYRNSKWREVKPDNIEQNIWIVVSKTINYKWPVST